MKSHAPSVLLCALLAMTTDDDGTGDDGTGDDGCDGGDGWLNASAPTSAGRAAGYHERVTPDVAAL